MELLLIKNSFGWKLMTVILFIGILYGCQKADRLSEPLPSKSAHRHAKPSAESADFVYQWFRFMAELQLPTPGPSPVQSYRNFAFIGVGLYESVQPGIKGARSLAHEFYQMPSMPRADMSQDYLWSASANAALASMFKLFLTNLTQANRVSVDSLEAAIHNRFRSTASDDVLARSQAFGRSIATAIHNWSTTDNFDFSGAGYTPLPFPWAWVPTSDPPTIAGVHVGNSRPFLEYSLTALAPPLPFPYSEDPASEFYKAAKDVYDNGEVGKNPEQAATARWWADAGGPGVGYPAPYHLLSIATNLLEDHHAGLWRAAEVYAKVGIGLKDGPIITFRSKYHYNLLRPITYIRRHINPTWNSVLPAPAYPDYTSGLIGNYGPVINVLIDEFGDIPVTDDIYTWRGLPARQFKSLSELLAEAAVSRVYAGIHYRFTQNISVEMGRALADEIAKVQIVGPKY